jgi:hypothetical protein
MAQHHQPQFVGIAQTRRDIEFAGQLARGLSGNIQTDQQFSDEFPAFGVIEGGDSIRQEHPAIVTRIWASMETGRIVG